MNIHDMPAMTKSAFEHLISGDFSFADVQPMLIFLVASALCVFFALAFQPRASRTSRIVPNKSHSTRSE